MPIHWVPCEQDDDPPPTRGGLRATVLGVVAWSLVGLAWYAPEAAGYVVLAIVVLAVVVSPHRWWPL